MTQTTIAAQLTIQCSTCGRHDEDVMVVGAPDRESARKAAMEFFRAECCDDEGITLDDGYLSKWSYEEPQPEDWQDHYVFRSCDKYPVDQREWWEK